MGLNELVSRNLSYFPILSLEDVSLVKISSDKKMKDDCFVILNLSPKK